MGTKDKMKVAVLGGVILVAVLGFGGYVGVYLPIQASAEAAEKLEDDNSKMQGQIDLLQKGLPRLAAAKAKSLPTDPEVARHEYEAILWKLVRDAKVPRGVSIQAKGSLDARAIPEVAAKVPAYKRIGYEIKMPAVDLGTLTDFLERYYELGLLHQITTFHVKKTEGGGVVTAARRASLGDRTDLAVTLVTEAAMLDGVDPRKTLRPVPPAAGAMFGAVGIGHLAQSPELARGLAPTAEPILAPNDREYLAVLNRDPFHGPIIPAPPPRINDRIEVIVAPPKEDITPFIKLTGISRGSDGTAEASIKDVANNLDYSIGFTTKDGTLVPNVQKFFFLRGKKRTIDGGSDLDISDGSNGTARKFRVAGLDGDALVLIAAPGEEEKPQETARGGFGAGGFGGAGGGGGFGGAGGRGGRTPNARQPQLPPAHPAAAFAGGFVANVPQDRVYRWKVGQTLKMVQELAPDEGQKLVEVSKSPWIKSVTSKTTAALVETPGD